MQHILSLYVLTLCDLTNHAALLNYAFNFLRTFYLLSLSTYYEADQV